MPIMIKLAHLKYWESPYVSEQLCLRLKMKQVDNQPNFQTEDSIKKKYMR